MKEKIISALSIGVTIVFFAVLPISLYNSIVANQYVHYNMARSVFLNLQESLNKWIILSLIISFFLCIVPPLCIFAAKSAWKFFLSNTLEVRVKDRSRLTRLVSVCALCSFLFLYGGWAINHYWLPHRFHPTSLWADLGILIFTIFLGWILLKLRLYRPLKTACSLLILLLLLNLGVVLDTRLNVPGGPNVILIIIDTLRADHLSCYGYDRNTTPHMDALASDSILFKNAISSAPWTVPSIASTITSQYPAVLGLGMPGDIDENFLTFAEIFRENNYVTQGIISHIYLGSHNKFDQGFDFYDEENAKGVLHVSSPSLTEKAISFLRKHNTDKSFLFLHYFDPHYSYYLQEGYNYFPDYEGFIESGEPIHQLRGKISDMSQNDIEYVKALYDSEISFTDAHIGKLLDELKEMGMYENTLIVLTADHGEEFLERDDYYIGHGRTLYQEQIHVPLIIKPPGVNGQKVIEDYVGLIDLLPTVVDYAGLTIPAEYRHEGRTIDPGNGKALNREAIISETEIKRGRKGTIQSVLRKGWKYIHDLEMNSKKLFNLAKDTGESNNLIEENKKVSKELEAILHRWRDQVHQIRPREEAKQSGFTQEEINRLKALGYVQ